MVSFAQTYIGIVVCRARIHESILMMLGMSHDDDDDCSNYAQKLHDCVFA